MSTPKILLTQDQPSGALRRGGTVPERSRSPEGYSSGGSDFMAIEDSPRRKRGSVDDPKPAIGKQVAEELGENSTLGEEIGNKLKDVIMKHRKGLQKMYGGTESDLDRTLEVPIKNGVDMVRSLTSEGMACDLETAKDLTVLTLYNVAILIDDSDSMRNEESGKRKKTLIQFVDHITEIYSMANESGILAMRFMNGSRGKKNWTGKSQEYLDHHSYGGVTRIGTELKKKILDIFVIGNLNQSKPLLVLIVTDGAIEGERKGHLKNVILDCVNEREEVDKGRDAVAFQFTRIGNDPGAARLLMDLDQDPNLGEYIDVLPVEFDLERRTSEKWFVLPKILLGAILPEWGARDSLRANETQSNEDWEE